MRLALSRVHFPVTTLGPGQRIGIWFQGCSIRCPGCISVDTWGMGREATTVAAVVASISSWLKYADGITISGGEPFDQPEALLALLGAIRDLSSVDTLVFSGHPLERIAEPLRGMPGLIDALVSDPYQLDSPQTLALRGSDNQRLHLLTPLGVQRFAAFQRAVTDEDMKLDVMFEEDGTAWMAGIPRRNDMRRLADLMATRGHQATTSQANDSGAEA